MITVAASSGAHAAVSWTAISTVVLAVAAIVGLILAGMSWLYKRGADERQLTLSIQEHSVATDNLSRQVAKIGERHEKLEDRVDNHETRISVNERDISANLRDISNLQRREHSTNPLGASLHPRETA